MVGTWTFFSKCFNLNKILFYQIELSGQIKIRPHLSKSINPVQRYFNLKVLQNLTLKWVKNTGKTVIELCYCIQTCYWSMQFISEMQLVSSYSFFVKGSYQNHQTSTLSYPICNIKLILYNIKML